MSQVTIHGKDGDTVGVIDDRLLTFAATDSEFEHVSEEESLSFTWASAQVNIDAADTIIMVRNVSDDLLLHIEDVDFGANVAAQFQVHLIKGSAALAGTAIVGVCLNQAKAKLAATFAEAKGDETTNGTQGSIIWAGAVAADTNKNIHYGGAIILAPGDAIGIDVVEEPAETNATISGYFKET
jgi:hypothetical protein